MDPAFISILVVIATIALLVGTRLAVDVVFMAGLSALVVTGVLSPAEAFAGFGNPGLVTVAVLYVVVAGLVGTGAVHAIGTRLLGFPKSLAAAQLRLMLPVTMMSAFLNNTPIVAMLVPAVEAWARRCRLPVSGLMIPLSYAAIFGGTCTIIGTSTNLVIDGLVRSSPQARGLGFFEIAQVGLPCAIVGVVFIQLTAR